MAKFAQNQILAPREAQGPGQGAARRPRNEEGRPRRAPFRSLVQAVRSAGLL